MERTRVAGGDDPSDGGLPTPRARRSRLATASAALLVAAGLAAYPAATTNAVPALVTLAGTLGVLLVVAALLVLWEDGLVAGPALLLVAYTLSLTSGREPLSRSAPLVAVGLVALVDLGAWSLELRDGAEEQAFAHLRTFVLLIAGAFAASVLVLTVGSLRAGGGIALWLLGAAAALGLLTLLTRAERGRALARP